MKNKTILIISPEAWGDNFVSKHHYANYLSKNNTVYYLNPPSGFTKQPWKGINLKKRILDSGMIVVDYLNVLPKLDLFPVWLQRIIYNKQAKQIQKQIGIDSFNIVWTFDPYRFFNQDAWEAEKKIYHTVDVHHNKCQEIEISASSDAILLSSELLRDKLKQFNDKIYKTGHASDIENFEKHIDNKQSLPGINKLKAGLISNYNLNIDYKLIENIARVNKSIDFIFVGPYTSNNLSDTDKQVKIKIDKLQTLENVHFVGSKPSAELMTWITAFDINLVLYKEERRDIIINPHKMMGYFYSGKITVSSWFHEYSDSSEDLLIMVQTNSELPAIIKQVGEQISEFNKIDLMTARRNFAILNSYENKIKEIKNILYN
ncbi:MAG: hypothetical protein AB8B72_13100 [Crocinitomicaceae bacterium]